jgi:archaellum component FlaC
MGSNAAPEGVDHLSRSDMALSIDSAGRRSYLGVARHIESGEGFQMLIVILAESVAQCAKNAESAHNTQRWIYSVGFLIGVAMVIVERIKEKKHPALSGLGAGLLIISALQFSLGEWEHGWTIKKDVAAAKDEDEAKSKLNDKIAGLNGTITGLNTTITDLNSNMTGLNTQMTGLNTQVGNLTNENTQLREDIERETSTAFEEPSDHVIKAIKEKFAALKKKYKDCSIEVQPIGQRPTLKAACQTLRTIVPDAVWIRTTVDENYHPAVEIFRRKHLPDGFVKDALGTLSEYIILDGKGKTPPENVDERAPDMAIVISINVDPLFTKDGRVRIKF